MWKGWEREWKRDTKWETKTQYAFREKKTFISFVCSSQRWPSKSKNNKFYKFHRVIRLRTKWNWSWATEWWKQNLIHTVRIWISNVIVRTTDNLFMYFILLLFTTVFFECHVSIFSHSFLFTFSSFGIYLRQEFKWKP